MILLSVLSLLLGFFETFYVGGKCMKIRQYSNADENLLFDQPPNELFFV